LTKSQQRQLSATYIGIIAWNIGIFRNEGGEFLRKIMITGFLLFSMIALVSCDENRPSFEQNLTLHFSKPDGQEYSIYKKIEDNETVNTLLGILQNVSWENAKVSMSRQPDHKILTVNLDPTVSYEPVIYAVWQSPKKDILEVIIEGQSKYGKISKENTKVLLSALGTPWFLKD